MTKRWGPIEKKRTIKEENKYLIIVIVISILIFLCK